MILHSKCSLSVQHLGTATEVFTKRWGKLIKNHISSLEHMGTSTHNRSADRFVGFFFLLNYVNLEHATEEEIQ